MIKWFKNFRNFKCHFCGIKDENVIQMWRTYCYHPGFTEYKRFHESCLKDVACEPEKHKIEDVYYAQSIFDWRKQFKEKQERNKQQRKEARENLKKCCVEEEWI